MNRRQISVGAVLLAGAALLSAGASQRPAMYPAVPLQPTAGAPGTLIPAGLDLSGLRPAAMLAGAGGRPAASIYVPPPPSQGLPSSPLPETITTEGPVPIPARVLATYQHAAARIDRTDPGCHLSWAVLAGIGAVESNHAIAGGSARPSWDGVARPPILGPVLDGSVPGSAALPDTDSGRLDGNTVWDRAVGPMQFLPSTWARDGVDGDGNGRADPQNIDDATLTAAGYLCAGGGDLADPNQLPSAVFAYNHSLDYVRRVLALAATYAHQPAPAVTSGPLLGSLTLTAASRPRPEGPAPVLGIPSANPVMTPVAPLAVPAPVISPGVPTASTPLRFASSRPAASPTSTVVGSQPSTASTPTPSPALSRSSSPATTLPVVPAARFTLRLPSQTAPIVAQPVSTGPNGDPNPPPGGDLLGIWVPNPTGSVNLAATVVLDCQPQNGSPLATALAPAELPVGAALVLTDPSGQGHSYHIVTRQQVTQPVPGLPVPGSGAAQLVLLVYPPAGSPATTPATELIAQAAPRG